MELPSCAGCPFQGQDHAPGGRRGVSLADLPVGVVLRFAPPKPASSPSEPGKDAGSEKKEEEVDESKRKFLKLAIVAGAVAATGATAFHFLEPGSSTPTQYPKVQLFYSDGSPVLVSQYPYAPSSIDLLVFSYPLTNEPNLLINLGTAVPNGVGPNSGLVAYSGVCQHDGCLPPDMSYYPAGQCSAAGYPGPLIHCVCHGSTFDPTTAAPGGGAAVLTGPAPNPLPQVLLEWDPSTDYLYAVGMVGPPVLNHVTTLQGGSLVPSTVQLSSPQAPTNQSCPSGAYS